MDAQKRLSEVVLEGDRRASLEAIRDKLALELEAAFGRDAATIGKQLTEVIRELDALPTGAGVSKLDELKKRRESRRKLSGM